MPRSPQGAPPEGRPREGRWPERRPRAGSGSPGRAPRRILLALALPLLLLAAVEGLLRAVGGDVLFPPGLESWERFVDPGDDILQRFRPGARLDFSLLRPGVSIPVRANRLGFRGEDPDRGAEGARRIACLGDSSTFGWFLREEDTWPAVLEQVLRDGGVAVRVGNFGLPGYTTYQGALVAERFVAPLRPDVAILAYGFNDAFEEGETDPAKRERLLREAARRRGFTGALRRLAEKTAIGRTLRLLREGRERAAAGAPARGTGAGPGGAAGAAGAAGPGGSGGSAGPAGSGGSGSGTGPEDTRRVPLDLQETSLRRCIRTLQGAGSHVIVLDLDLANSYGAARRARVAAATGCLHLDAAAMLLEAGEATGSLAGAYRSRGSPPAEPPRGAAKADEAAPDRRHAPAVTIELVAGPAAIPPSPGSHLHVRPRDATTGEPLWSGPLEGHAVAGSAGRTWRWPKVRLPGDAPLEFTVGSRELAADPAARSKAGWIPMPLPREIPAGRGEEAREERGGEGQGKEGSRPRIVLTWPGPLEPFLLAGERIHPNAAASRILAERVAVALRQKGFLPANR